MKIQIKNGGIFKSVLKADLEKHLNAGWELVEEVKEKEIKKTKEQKA